jgi:phosphatidylserine decarboxylase
MNITREGYPLILTVGLAAVVVLALGWGLAAGVLILMTIAVAAFFRDPERHIPDAEGLIVAPADGRVVSIAKAKSDAASAQAATRVSIFLSPLDVHINRIPVAGKIEEVRYRSGKFFAAYKEEASERNERNALEVVDDQGRKVVVVQIAGVLARRIVCRARPGDRLKRGERFGLIMFGSRTDTYLPDGCNIEVSEGQRVKGGETVLGRFL